MKGIANESSKAFLANVADGVSQVIRWVINLAPFGIMGLVFTSVSENGLAAFTEYGSLLLLLVGTMLLMVLVFGRWSFSCTCIATRIRWCTAASRNPA